MVVFFMFNSVRDFCIAINYVSFFIFSLNYDEEHARTSVES